MSAGTASRRAGMLVLWVVVVLAGLEGAVRVFRPQATLAATVNTWDPDVGTRQIPGARGFICCPEYSTDLVINSKGLRDREFPYEKPKGTRRILSLGDSFAAGYGVQADETYAKVLERGLAERRVGGATWEVLNAAVGSTGTAHHLAYYLNDGRRYEPDIVLVGFFVSNDFWDNVSCGLYTLEGGSLVKRQAPCTWQRKVQRVSSRIPAYNSLFSRSHLLNLIKGEVAARHRRDLAELAERSAPSSGRGDSHAITWHLLRELRGACAADGAQFVVVVIPAPIGSPAEHRGLEAELVRFLEAEGIPCLNLGPAYRERSREMELSYPVDRHWNACGHEFAGGEICTFLIEHRLVSDRAGAVS